MRMMMRKPLEMERGEKDTRRVAMESGGMRVIFAWCVW